MASDGGKGSAQRPTQVPQDVVDTNWENIFGKKPKVESTPLYDETLCRKVTETARALSLNSKD